MHVVGFADRLFRNWDVLRTLPGGRVVIFLKNDVEGSIAVPLHLNDGVVYFSCQ